MRGKIGTMPQEQVQEEVDPFGNGKLPSGRHGLPRDVVVRSQRERMVEAMIGVVAEKGYTETTVADIISTAGVSRATFYEQFADKEDCFIAAYGTVMERMLTFVADGFAQDGSDDWVVQIRGGIGALLSYLADNPVAARVGIVEGFGAEPGPATDISRLSHPSSLFSIRPAPWSTIRTGYRPRSRG